ncbi:MAG: DUF1559 domain-containing protein [Planctomycetota bacterium]|nr:DUF1559 domain-containing protein [Planctomycetota bacterium]
MPPGMNMGGMMGPGPNPTGGSGGQAPAAVDSALPGLLKYVPPSLTQAAGLDVKAVAGDKANLAGVKLLHEFEAIFSILAKGGITPDKVEYILAGCNRDSGDLLICVKTSAAIEPFLKRLGEGTKEKVGKATINLLSTGPQQNAACTPEGKILLLGRATTLRDAVSSPAAGGIRGGIDAMAQPGAFYWIAGDSTAATKRMAGSDFPLLEDYAAEGARMVGYAMGVGGSSSAPGGSAGGPPNGMAPGMPSGMAPGMPQVSPGAPSGMPGAAGGQEGRGKRISAVFGMVFQSEGLAVAAETRLGELMRKYSPRQGGMPGMPGMPGGANGDFRFQSLLFPERFRVSEDRDFFAQQPAGAPPIGAPSRLAECRVGKDQDPEKLISVNVGRSTANIRLAMSIPNRPDLGVVFVEKAYNDAIQAIGAVALADGLFDGSLAAIRAGYDGLVAEKAGQLKGVRAMGEDRALEEGYSWMTDLLPHIGYKDLYLQFDTTKTWMVPLNRVHAYVVIPQFVNPADPNVQWNGHPYDGVGLTHFAGMAGIEDKRTVVAAELPRTDPRAGIFGYDQVVKLADIKDGTSQTIMLIGTGKSSAPWIQGGGGTVRGARAPYFDKFHGFGSYGIPGQGVYVMMADGSTRVINASIDPEVFKSLCTIQGGEQVDLQKIVSAAQ